MSGVPRPPRPSGRAEVLVVASQKGGVGKTTSAVHLAAALGAGGSRCLLWDLDANQGATTHLGVHGERFLGAAEVLTGRERLGDVVLARGEEVDLPANVDLVAASAAIEFVTRDAAERHLAAALAEAAVRYDFVILDTPPNLTAPAVAAYRAAQWFLLSAVPEPFALVGLRRAIDTLARSMARGTARGRLLGVLFAAVATGGRRPRLEDELLEYARTRLRARDGRPLLLPTSISRSAIVPRCQMAGRTVFQENPRHKVALQYREVADEIERRIRAWATEA
jgi:chromosome partitioning protein